MVKKSTRSKIKKRSKRSIMTGRTLKQYLNELYAMGHHYVIKVPENKNAVGPMYGNYLIVANLTVVENYGLGDCLFLSIHQYLEHINYIPLPSSVKDLRSKIVDHVILNWQQYAFALLNYDTKLQRRLDKYYCPEFDNVEKCQEIYRKAMSNREWGTTVELSAATDLFDFKVVQLTLDPEETTLSITKLLESEAKGKPPFFLLFNGSSLKGHFRFLRPLEAFFARSNPNLDNIPNGDYRIRTTGNVTSALYGKRQHYVKLDEWKTESESEVMSE